MAIMKADDPWKMFHPSLLKHVCCMVKMQVNGPFSAYLLQQISISIVLFFFLWINVLTNTTSTADVQRFGTILQNFDM